MKPITLTVAARALANGTPKGDDGRPVLKGVFVNENEAVVANGFIVVIKALVAPEMDLGDQIDNGLPSVIIPDDALKACKGDNVKLTTIETMQKSGELMQVTTKNVVRLEGEDFSVEANAIEGTYPSYQDLFGKSAQVAEVAVNASVIKTLLKTLPDDGILRLRISKPDKAIEFQCTDPDGEIPIRGLIMPMNVSWQDNKWLTKDE